MVIKSEYARSLILENRLHFLKYFFTSVSLITAIVVYFRVWYFKESIEEHYLLFLMIATGVIGFISTTINKNIFVSRLCLFLFSSIILPLRVYTTGGNFSYALVWVFSLLIVVYFVSDKKYFLVASAMWFLTLLANLFIPFDVQTHPLLEASSQARGLTNILGFLVFFVLIYYIKKVESEAISNLASTERVKVSKILYARSAHEILSPLSAVRGYAQLLHKKQNYSFDHVEGIISSSDKICEIIKDLEEAVENDQINPEFQNLTKPTFKTT